MESRTVKISLVAAAALLMTTGCIARGLRREKGPSVEQTREVAAYTAIQTGGGIDVVLSDELKAGQIVVVASEKMQDQILTEVEGGELNIRLRPSLFGWFGPGSMKVIVPNTGTLTRLRASGGSDIWADQVMLRGRSLEIGCSGGSDFKGKVTVDELDVACSGGSDFKGEVTSPAAPRSARWASPADQTWTPSASRSATMSSQPAAGATPRCSARAI